MKLTLIKICCITCILLAACHNAYNNDQHSVKISYTTSKNTGKATFLDTIMAKKEIPALQLQQHIDTGHFFHCSAFSGDTVYYPDSNFPVAGLSMDYDKVCTKIQLLYYSDIIFPLHSKQTCYTYLQ